MKAHFLLPWRREPIGICRHRERERWKIVIGPHQGDLEQVGPFPLRSILRDDLEHEASCVASRMPTSSPRTVVWSLSPGQRGVRPFCLPLKVPASTPGSQWAVWRQGLSTLNFRAVNIQVFLPLLGELFSHSSCPLVCKKG